MKRFFTVMLITLLCIKMSAGHCRNYLIVKADDDRKSVKIVGGVAIDDRYLTASIVMLRASGIPIVIALMPLRLEDGTLRFRGLVLWRFRNGGRPPSLDEAGDDNAICRSLIIGSLREQLGTACKWFYEAREFNYGCPPIQQLNVKSYYQGRLCSIDGVSIDPMSIVTPQGIHYVCKKNSLSSSGWYLKRGVCDNGLSVAPFHFTPHNIYRLLHLVVVALIEPDIRHGFPQPFLPRPEGNEPKPFICHSLTNQLSASGKVVPGKLDLVENLKVVKPETVSITEEEEGYNLCGSPPENCQNNDGWNNDDWGDGGGCSGVAAY